MASDKHCCVPGCKDSGAMHRVLHGFPNPEKDQTRFNAWLYAIGSDILGLENERIYKYRRVCHSHFEEKYICRFHRLSNIAVPTLNIPGPLSPKRLCHKITNIKPMKQTTNITANQPDAGEGSSQIAKNTYCKRKPFEEIGNQPELTMSSDPPSLQQISTSIEIGKESSKENIVSTTLRPELLPKVLPTSLDKMDHTIQGGGIKNPIKKHTKKVFMTIAAQKMYKKIVAMKVKLSKMKNKVQKQSAQIKAAKKMVIDPEAANFFANSSNTARLLIKLQGRENKKKRKRATFHLRRKDFFTGNF